MNRRASKCWLIGIWLSILQALIELYKASKRQSMLMLSKANQSKADGLNQSNEDYESQMKAVRAAKVTQVLNVIKNLGDSITASQALGYP